MYYKNNGDRVFGVFAVPFLLGAATGGVAVGLTRPRPVYTTYPAYPPTPYPYPNYGYGYPYYR